MVPLAGELRWHLTQGFHVTSEPEDVSAFSGQGFILEADDLAHPSNCLWFACRALWIMRSLFWLGVEHSARFNRDNRSTLQARVELFETNQPHSVYKLREIDLTKTSFEPCIQAFSTLAATPGRLLVPDCRHNPSRTAWGD